MCVFGGGVVVIARLISDCARVRLFTSVIVADWAAAFRVISFETCLIRFVGG